MTNAHIHIPWMKPCFSGKEKQYLIAALESTWISGGQYVKQFEDDFKNYAGASYALACANGTAALHLAFLGLGIGPGDEVILPAFGFLAAANVLLNLHARPIFVDVDGDTWCMSPECLEKAISSNTKVIVVVHPLGNLCNMDAIIAIGREYCLPIIEDAAEGFPSLYKDKVAGGMGMMGTYSFQATKSLTTGEGGMIITNSEPIAERIALYRSHGMKRKRHYWHELPGLNYRLTNLQAALGCAQFAYLSEITIKRLEMYKSYIRHFEGVVGLKMQTVTPNVSPVIWAVGVELNPHCFPQGRDAVIEQMSGLGIETRPGFYTPYSIDYFDCGLLPVSQYLSEQVLLLPSWPDLTEKLIAFISSSLTSLRCTQTYV